MKRSRIAFCAALGVVLLGSSTVAFGQGTPLKTGGTDGKNDDQLSLEIVGQVQNSAPGVSPATSIQYG
jgi:hypothetical protein